MAKEWSANRREKLIGWLWERMQKVHGEAWVQNYGPVWDPKRERARKEKPQLFPKLARTAAIWADYLNGFEAEAIGQVVTQIADSGDLLTLPQFVERCREVAGKPTSTKPTESDAERQARRQRAHQALSALRERLTSENHAR